MAFFKKLVPGRSGKDNGSNKPGTGGDINPANELAAKPAAPLPAKGNPLTRDAAALPPGKGPKPGSLASESAELAGTHEQFRKQMQSLLNEDQGARQGSTKLTDEGEAGSKIRPQDRRQELSVSQETDMLEILSEQAGLKYVKLSSYPKSNITPELLRLVPSEVARAYKVFPIEQQDDGTVVIAISDPLNVRIVDDLRLMLVDKKVRNVEAVVANEEEIMDYTNLFYGIGDQTLDQMVEAFESQDTSTGMETREGTLDLSDIDKIAQEGPVIRFCNLLLLQAIKERASDLHIEPFSNVLRIRYRVDGVLREIPSPPKSWQLGVLSRMKVMASLDISETRRPQDGRLKLTVEGREIDLRLSTLPVVHGECLVMRLLDKSVMMVGVQQVGMTPDVLERFMKIIERPNGILLVTGPTGSGKTTTLYAALNEINDPTEKIITTEDPVEYQVEGLVQVNINVNVGLTFAKCLRAILRQDPDVILVGEIRDSETAQIAIQASLTGHLVFSTLHTNSASATVSRLVDMGVEPFLITSCLEGIIAQRLVRMVCQRCKQPYRPTAEELADFGTTPQEVADITFLKGTGCDECSQTGYKGRIGIFELLMVTDEIRTLILERGTTDDIQATALEQGMKTMRQDGWLKICLGVTTFEEVAKHTPKETKEQIKREMKDIVHEKVAAVTGQQDVKPIVPMSSIAPPGSDEAGMKARDAGDADKA